MNIAEKIKNARSRAGMSQQELADKLHVSRSAVAKWESDKGLPDIENLKAIAGLFGMTLDELTGEGDGVTCTLRESQMAEDPEEAVRIRWPEAVRIDWMLLRHDFGPAGWVLNALSFGWFGAIWRLFHGKECDVNRCRYYLVDNFDEHIFVQAREGELYITPLGRRVLRSERDGLFCHMGRSYEGVGKICERQKPGNTEKEDGFMKKFWGLYNNGTYQVGCQEVSMHLYDTDGRELARFRDLRYAPRGAFQPGTNIFVLRSTEGRLAVYDCDARKLLKKWNFSAVRYAQDDGFCFSPDGKLFYNIERFPRDTQTRLTIYETEGFTPIKVLYEGEKDLVLTELHCDTIRNQIQVLSFRRDNEGVYDQGYVGKLEGDEIAALHPLSKEEFEFLRSWLNLRTFGFTEKAMEWSGLHYEGYTNNQIRRLRDQEPDLYAFDLKKMIHMIRQEG